MHTSPYVAWKITESIDIILDTHSIEYQIDQRKQNMGLKSVASEAKMQ